MRHELKTLPAFFQAAWVQDKTFEIRNNDRNFQERDEICLQEWEPEAKEYSGREIHGIITYLTSFHQAPGWVVFAYRSTRFSE